MKANNGVAVDSTSAIHEQVLSAYLSRCLDQSSPVDFASNSVLEWFGRTLRGSERIMRFFRNDIQMNRHLKFSRAEQCEPFEAKPTHRETLLDPPENYVADRIVDQSDATTPPAALRIVPSSKPPPLTRGRRFRPIDSPEDSSVPATSFADVSGIHQLLTPEKALDSTSPPRPVGRHAVKQPTAVVVCPAKPSAAKRSTERPTEATSPKQLRSSIRTAAPNRFGPLLHLKATGVLRQHRSTKHRGVTAPSTPVGAASDTDFWDREVLLLTSFRMCLADNKPQFALIVYEHQTRNPKTRRNLIAEFHTLSDGDQEAVEDALQAASELPPSNSASPATPVRSTTTRDAARLPATSSSSAKKMSLRRLRF